MAVLPLPVQFHRLQREVLHRKTRFSPTSSRVFCLLDLLHLQPASRLWEVIIAPTAGRLLGHRRTVPISDNLRSILSVLLCYFQAVLSRIMHFFYDFLTDGELADTHARISIGFPHCIT